MITTAARYMLAGQATAVLLSARTWWNVWLWPCEPAFQDAAFWTGLTMSQGVVIIAYIVLLSA